MIDMLRNLEPQVADSRAIAVVTAHWEAEIVGLSGAQQPTMLFDYYSFPAETYAYDYPAPGTPDLAEKASPKSNERHGWSTGTLPRERNSATREKNICCLCMFVMARLPRLVLWEKTFTAKSCWAS